MTGDDQPPVVLIDTTEFFRRPSLGSGGWPELLARVKRRELELLVSEVTLREEKRQTHRKLDTALAEVRKGLGRLRERGSQPDEIQSQVELAVADVRAQHSEGLRRGLLDHGATVLPIPPESVEELLERDLDGRMPFESSGKGFRDSLIWLSLVRWLGEIDEDRDLFVVTANTNDFTDSKTGQLHVDLADDLSWRPVSATRVVGGIPELNEIFRERFAELDERREILADIASEEDERREAMTAAVVAAVSELVGQDVADRDEEHWGSGIDFGDALPMGMVSAAVDGADADPASIEFDLQDSYDGDTYAFSARVLADLTVSGYADVADAVADDHPFDWVDLADLGRPETEVGASLQAELSFNLIVVNGAVEDVAFDSVVHATRLGAQV